ncbi:3 beta-hydroxysteroid dehydrogenase/Delta 5--_4-isomerase [Planctomycetes bacterium Pla163]|uniref:3 beta-hydroxysteroid dehydrogenase/Delta 5-->4-isomerase n=1 Tax=Rohdeia mirabilis TaxID=2528008 RepID=A0A518CXF7_9BACT|nr:3 beta-hydroxysteroid dehydrogenase/Delta 5-->4-isomerase [Planctomycetes bacterium Pla163]
MAIADEGTAGAPRRRVLVTGATGYVGGRLVPRLLDAGHTVRCLARDGRKLRDRPWSRRQGVAVVEGDLESRAETARALADCDVAYYLVHSMEVAGSEYGERDRRLALQFAEEAERAGVERIVYLGGLGETGPDLSDHLTSRREVERCLRSSAVPVTVLRAAMIIGSGSASFEILRYLVEHLPVMITPKWVSTRCQPIAIRNVLFDLVACLDEPRTIDATLDIGGPDVLTYRELMQTMAEVRGLRRRLVVPVPVLTPRLSSLWIHLVTPMSRRMARPLAEGLRNEVVCSDGRAQELMPQRLLGVRESMELALANLEAGRVETKWSDAGPVPGDPDWSGGNTFVDAWSVDVNAEAETVFRAICRIGGGHGWYGAQWLWSLRGWMDRLVGGPGLRRGRRDPTDVEFGEALDFWRVTDLDRPRALALRAEMKLPGEAELAFRVEPPRTAGGPTRLVQTARFVPRGLLGLAYWYAVLPLHAYVFRGMLDGIRRAAESEADHDGDSQHPIERVEPTSHAAASEAARSVATPIHEGPSDA